MEREQLESKQATVAENARGDGREVLELTFDEMNYVAGGFSPSKDGKEINY